MTERQRQIASAFQRFSLARRQKPEDLVVAVVGIVLDAAGQAGLVPDEVRYLAACIDCGWWVPYTPKGQLDRVGPATGTADAFCALPDASTASLPARCTLFD